MSRRLRLRTPAPSDDPAWLRHRIEILEKQLEIANKEVECQKELVRSYQSALRAPQETLYVNGHLVRQYTIMGV